jgi:UDP-glucose 4-epimerase
LEAAKNNGVRKVIVSSSAGIFGELKTFPIAEDHPIEPDSPYGCTKLCEEKLSLAYLKLYPIEVVCLRYFNVYGQNQRYDAYGNAIPIFVFRMLRGDSIIIYGDGEQTRDFVNVQDVVQANIKAAEAFEINGAYNIGSGQSISINNLVRLITKHSSDSYKIEYRDRRSGDVLHSLADISLAMKTFGYSPSVALEDGISDYVAWAKLETSGTKPTL